MLEVDDNKAIVVIMVAVSFVGVSTINLKAKTLYLGDRNARNNSFDPNLNLPDD